MLQERSGKANLESSRIESTVKIVVLTMEKGLSLLEQQLIKRWKDCRSLGPLGS